MKETVKLVFAMIYLLALPLIQKKPYRIILCYHGVRKQNADNFEKQIGYLVKSTCKVVKASEVLTAHPDGCSSIVAVTFDDAFVSVMENAVPILRKYGCPAAVFVPVGNLGKQPCWSLPDKLNRNGTVVNRQQIVELDSLGFEIFSHTLLHPVLTKVEDGRLRDELSGSKNLLEEIVGHKVLAVSYPHGAHDRRVCDAAKQAGYQLGFTIEPCVADDATDDMRIGRFIVSSQDSLLKLRLKISGAYQVEGFLRAIKNSLIRYFSFTRFWQCHTK